MFKLANPPAMPPVLPGGDAARVARAQILRGQLAKMLGLTAVVGGGAGMLGRAIGGGVSAVQQQLSPHPTYTPDAPLTIEVDAEKEKLAQVGGTPVEQVIDTVGENVGGFLGGNYARTPMEIPIAMPAMALAGAGSAYAGWKGMDYVFDKIRQQQLQAELAKVKQRYHQALSPAQDEKQASAASSDVVDQLFDTWQEKKADATNSWWSVFKDRLMQPSSPPAAVGGGGGAPPVPQGTSVNNPDNFLGPLGQLTGTIGLPLLGAGVGTSALAYYLAKRRGQNNVVSKARRQFENNLQQQRPPSIAAVPRVGEDED
jgi:hypothetical protein